ncbi:hypothetical protein AaE_006751, partial [Aphanomyces astaci]
NSHRLARGGVIGWNVGALFRVALFDQTELAGVPVQLNKETSRGEVDDKALIAGIHFKDELWRGYLGEDGGWHAREATDTKNCCEPAQVTSRAETDQAWVPNRERARWTDARAHVPEASEDFLELVSWGFDLGYHRVDS